jgi:hypothetical protein
MTIWEYVRTGSGSRDQHAIHRIMGHTIAGMAGIYVQRITDDRLKAVTDAVRNRLLCAPTSCFFGQDDEKATATLLGEALDDLVPAAQ